MFEQKKSKLKAICLATLIPLCGFSGLFGISIEFDPNVEESYKTAFYNAATFWETQITGYRWDDALLQGVAIRANVATNDAPGGILGSVRARRRVASTIASSSKATLPHPTCSTQLQAQ